MNSKKQEMLKYCRYYNGEKECPFKDGMKPMFWEYEKIWLEHMLLEEEEMKDFLADLWSDYKRAGLELFAQDDGVPLGLKTLLYNRFDHWAQGGAEDFKEWYTRVYLAGGN